MFSSSSIHPFFRCFYFAKLVKNPGFWVPPVWTAGSGSTLPPVTSTETATSDWTFGCGEGHRGGCRTRSCGRGDGARGRSEPGPKRWCLESLVEVGWGGGWRLDDGDENYFRFIYYMFNVFCIIFDLVSIELMESQYALCACCDEGCHYSLWLTFHDMYQWW